VLHVIVEIWRDSVSVELGIWWAYYLFHRWYMSEYEAKVELYWQEKTEELWEIPVPVPFCPPQIPCGLTWEWIHHPLTCIRKTEFLWYAMYHLSINGYHKLGLFSSYKVMI
jgi:hypothetical protein